MTNLVEKTLEEMAGGVRTAEAYAKKVAEGGVASEFGSQVPGPQPQRINPVQVPGTPAAVDAVTLAGTPAHAPPVPGVSGPSGPAVSTIGPVPVAVFLGLTGPTGVNGPPGVATTGVSGPTFGPVPSFLRKIETEIEDEFHKLEGK